MGARYGRIPDRLPVVLLSHRHSAWCTPALRDPPSPPKTEEPSLFVSHPKRLFGPNLLHSKSNPPLRYLRHAAMCMPGGSWARDTSRSSLTSGMLASTVAGASG